MTKNEVYAVARQLGEHRDDLHARGRAPQQPAREASLQMREEGIGFVLHAGLEAGQHGDDQHG